MEARLIFTMIGAIFHVALAFNPGQRGPRLNVPSATQAVPVVSPLNIDVTFVIQDISSIKPIDMDFKMDYLVAYNWTIEGATCLASLKDWSAARSHQSGNVLQTPHNISSVVAGDKYHMSAIDASKYFWLPDVNFMDVKKLDTPNGAAVSSLVIVTVPSESQCSVLLETSLSATVACFFSFRLSPYDQQICSFRMRSQLYPLPYLKFNWSKKGVLIGRDYKLSLNHYEAYFKFNHTHWHSSHIGSNEPNYSTLQITFKFDRKISNFAVSVVIPTVLMVIVAYSSFWITVDSGPGRFLLTVLTLLALVTQFSGLRNQLPAISYVSAGDIWLITCMMFVFLAIIELAIVNYLDKRRKLLLQAVNKSREAEEEREQLRVKGLRDKFNKDLQYGYSSVRLTPSIIKALDAEEDEVSVKSLNCSRLRPFGKWTPGHMLTFARETPLSEMREPIDIALKIDVAARIVYPILFAIFNLLYWSLLLTRSI